MRLPADWQILAVRLCVALLVIVGGTTALDAQASVPKADALANRVIGIGRSAVGTLDARDVLSADSTYVQRWTLAGQAGQTVTIELTSTEFDAYVMLRGPGITGSRDYSDDDSGGHCNARLTVTFPQTGDYEIIVNTRGKLEQGAFTLTIEAGSKPKSLTRCNR